MLELHRGGVQQAVAPSLSAMRGVCWKYERKVLCGCKGELLGGWWRAKDYRERTGHAVGQPRR